MTFINKQQLALTTKFTRRSFVLAGTTMVLAACSGTAKRESTGEMLDDTAITAKVKAAFVEAEEISVFDVSVETFKGTVQLSGFVDTEAQRVAAEQIAGGVAGVVKVENKISVK